MRERARRLGGDFDVVTGNGHGTDTQARRAIGSASLETG
jgi:signal transduction histidine kinase